jgi:AcrR family transcriptional regulator
MPGARADPAHRRRQILDAVRSVAGRQGLDHITVRQVAAEAGLSSGLVFFHFHTKDALLLGLLDDLLTWLLAGDPEAPPLPPPTTFPDLIRSEMQPGPAESARAEALLQFWVLGQRRPRIRRRIRSAMERYQDLFLQAARGTLGGRPEMEARLTPESLAGLSVALVLGGQVASMLDPKWFVRWDPVAPIEYLLHAQTEKPVRRPRATGEARDLRRRLTPAPTSPANGPPRRRRGRSASQG